MPRKGKGGSREGAPQTAYANRTDLNRRGPEPVTTAPGQAYGEAKAQADAQRAVPMAGVAQPPPAPNAPAAPTGATQPVPGPGEIPWLHPTQRPDEPVTAGLPNSAGPGPESLGVPINQESKLSDILANAAAHPAASQQVMALAEMARRFDL